MSSSKKHSEVPLSLNIGSRTDIGRVRTHNEDSLLVHEPLFVVADGMGGHEAGEVASEIAVNTMDAAAGSITDAATLGDAVIQANRAVIQGARSGVGKPGMGTTMTAAFIDGDMLAVAQVGDSRAYLLHQGLLQQITRDHSLMAELIEAGQITEEEARVHPNRSIITRALGSDPSTEPDIFELTLEPGDRLLLCSDGLSGMLIRQELQQILGSIPDPQQAADQLIKRANDAGGHDNITAIVVDVLHAQPMIKKRQRRHFRLSLIAFLLAFLTIIVIAVGGVYVYAQNAAYLIAENGTVRVYQGLIGNVAGFSLSWYVEDTGVPVSQLPTPTAERLQTGIPFDSLGNAENVVTSYRTQIASENSKANTYQGITSGSTTSTGTNTQS